MCSNLLDNYAQKSSQKLQIICYTFCNISMQRRIKFNQKGQFIKTETLRNQMCIVNKIVF